MKIISNILWKEFTAKIDFSPAERLKTLAKKDIDFDYFQFYNSVSSVYSSRIEGEYIALDSYLKHKFQHVEFLPAYTKRVDDLFDAYFFIKNHNLTYYNFLKAHEILSKNILPMHQRGRIRTGLMNVINENGRIIYVAPTQFQVNEEFEKLFSDIDLLLTKELNEVEIFYYAASIHLVFAKIHPMNDGNGRSVRLLEKWFLVEKFGNDSFAIPLEKNYYQNILKYYEELQKTGLEYDFTDYSKALSFLLMTVQCLDK